MMLNFQANDVNLANISTSIMGVMIPLLFNAFILMVTCSSVTRIILNMSR